MSATVIQHSLRGGVAALEVLAGGFALWVYPGRGMDLGPCSWEGTPVAWESGRGPVPPAEAPSWLDAFHGGLCATCGYANVGPPCVDEGVAYGQHGRVSLTPARGFCWSVSGEDVAIRGIVRDGDLTLDRLIHVTPGRRTIDWVDTVHNTGLVPQALMVQYHVNFGAPFAQPGAVLWMPPGQVRPRDEASAAFAWEEYPELSEGPEHAYFHTPSQSIAVAAQPDRRFGVAVHWDLSTLPYMVQWRLPRPGNPSLGLEPNNAPVKSRTRAREAGALEWLASGERRRFGVAVEVLPDSVSVHRAVTEVQAAATFSHRWFSSVKSLLPQ